MSQEAAGKANRRLVHTRSVQVQAYAREDGLWDLEATVRDVKERDVPIDAGVRRAREAFHDMHLTVTINTGMQIIAAHATTQAAPYGRSCDTTPDLYQQLVGLNLLQGFRRAVRERIGGTGCTHINELAAVLPTAAIQAFVGEVRLSDPDSPFKPPHLDRCHALRSDGPVVAKYYPRWYRKSGEVQ